MAESNDGLAREMLLVNDTFIVRVELINDESRKFSEIASESIEALKKHAAEAPFQRCSEQQSVTISQCSSAAVQSIEEYSTNSKERPRGTGARLFTA